MSNENGLAPSPPMGWNSWNCFGTTVTEEEVLQNAEVMRTRLLPFGYDTVVVDIQWYEPAAKAHGYRKDAELVLDANGRTAPAVNRFPSAAGGAGFRPLASRIHAMGLKFGIHILRGIPRQAVQENLPILGTAVRAADIALPDRTCAWNTDMVGVDVSRPEGRAYYQGLADLYASWGVDYVKVDDMGTPLWADELEALHTALARCGRPIVLSVSPGIDAKVENAPVYRRHCELWRISPDLWDIWEKPQWYAVLFDQFARVAAWSGEAGPGHWPDPDMLPLGRIGVRAEVGDDRLSRLTPPEQVSLMTLWCISRAPLMMGGDLRALDPFTDFLLTRSEVLEALKTGSEQRELRRDASSAVWTSKAGEGLYAALFNLGDSFAEVSVPLKELGLPEKARARDLWRAFDLGTLEKTVSALLPPHGAVFYRLL